MAICKACGVEKAGFMSDLCSNCMDKPATPSPSPQSIASAAASPTAQSSSSTQEQGSASTCLALGVISLLIGLYFLIDPTTGSSLEYGSQVANIHKLTLGETFSIMGAIFLAAGLRPRR